MKIVNRITNFISRIILRILYSNKVGLVVVSYIILPIIKRSKTKFFLKSKLVSEGAYSLKIVILKRFRFYHEGLLNRINGLAAAYGIDKIALNDNDVVIDCGANIGELGLYLRSVNFNGYYHAIEPDPNINKTCILNNNHSKSYVYDILLSAKDQDLDFYLSSEDADSSAFKPDSFSKKIKKQSQSLESFLKQNNLSRIKLFKIEAEGYEPEVLEGALNVLNRIEYIAIDCGPERGNEDTVVDCFNVLFDNNFQLVFSNLARGSFLFMSK